MVGINANYVVTWPRFGGTAIKQGKLSKYLKTIGFTSKPGKGDHVVFRKEGEPNIVLTNKNKQTLSGWVLSKIAGDLGVNSYQLQKKVNGR